MERSHVNTPAHIPGNSKFGIKVQHPLPPFRCTFKREQVGHFCSLQIHPEFLSSVLCLSFTEINMQMKKDLSGNDFIDSERFEANKIKKKQTII